MQIAYKIPGATGDWIVLADASAGAFIKEWKPRASGQVQKSNVAVVPGQIANSQRQPLGNLKETIPLFLDVSYNAIGTLTAPAAAQAAARTNKTAFMGNVVHLRLTEGAETQYYPNGTTDSFESLVAGCNVVYNFTIETDFVTTTEPA
jgi:hypothetical protein